MRSLTDYKKIILKQHQGSLTYSLEYPLIAGNENVYCFLIDANSIEDLITAKEIGSITLKCQNTKSLAVGESTGTRLSEQKIINNQSSDYYFFEMPINVLTTTGKLRFSIVVKSKTGEIIYRTTTLSYPPDIYPAEVDSGVYLDATQYNQLLKIITALQGGEDGQALIKSPTTEADINSDYNFTWDNVSIAKAATKLQNARSFLVSGKLGGASNQKFDGSKDCEIKITDINFGINDKEHIKGILPAEVIPTSKWSQMTYGGVVDALNGTILLSKLFQGIKGLSDESIKNPLNVDAISKNYGSIESFYFLCNIDGEKPISLKNGDWLIYNNTSWTKITVSTSITSVKGSNDNEDTTFESNIVLDANNVGAARGDLTVKPDTIEGYAAYRANKLTTAQSINGLKFNGSSPITNYCFCDTPSNVSQKCVNLANFSLVTGALLCIAFKYNNTASNITLKINNTEEKNIYFSNSIIGGSDESIGPTLLKSNYVYLMVYDGEKWIVASGIDSAPTQLACHRTVKTLLGGQTSFEIPETISEDTNYAKLFVYVDGELLSNGLQYKIEGNNVINLTPMDYDRTVECVEYYSEKINLKAIGVDQLADNTETTPIIRAQKADGWTDGKTFLFNQGDDTYLTLAENAGKQGEDNITLTIPKNKTINIPNIKGHLIGDVTGDVNGKVVGSLDGNAATTTRLKEARNIGLASFDGTQNLTLEAIGAVIRSIDFSIPFDVGWGINSKTAQIKVENLKNTDNVLVVPSDNQQTNWCLYKIYCIKHDNQFLTFSCQTIPTVDITGKIIILPSENTGKEG